jgi:NADH:ubiquinone oxidoreductase subunit 4 (subunit M)
MHGRGREDVDGRDILPVGPDLLTIAPLIAVIVALGVCPQIVLDKLDTDRGSRGAEVSLKR